MKYMALTNKLAQKIEPFWNYLDDPDCPERDNAQKQYSYIGYRHYGHAEIKEIMNTWNITFAYVMHYRAELKYPWNSPGENDFTNKYSVNANEYLKNHGLSKFHGNIFLENKEEVEEFITTMGPYPMVAQYVNFYLFCNNNIILEIGHHNDIFIYKSNLKVK